MSDDMVRFIVAVLASLSVAGIIASITGPRWGTLTPRYRRISLAVCGPLLAVVFSIWYAASHEFPLNPFIYMQGAFDLVLVVCVFYGIRSGK